MTLSARATGHVVRADRQAVVDAFASLVPYLSDGRWLGTNNRYQRDTIENLRTDVLASALKQKHLAEYVAASVPLHALDGWAYLGRALHAQLTGDVFSARHLGYYAELRAAMSILAAEGVAVFSGQHFVVTSPTTVEQIRFASSERHGTHVFAWEALEWWASSSAAAKAVGDAFRPLGRPLNEWLGAVPRYAAWVPVAQDLVRQLGLDLGRVAQDQTSRNEASYRPTRARSPLASDTRANAAFAISLWDALEPVGSGSWSMMDLHLLRRLFEEAFLAVEGAPPRSLRPQFRQATDDLLDAMAIQGASRSFVRSFVTRRTQSAELPIMSYAATDSPTSHRRHHAHVLSRAALLLQVASARCRTLMNSAGVTAADTAFWWGLLGSDRGLWDVRPEAVDLLDYWDDVRIELDDLQSWLTRGSESCALLVAEGSKSVCRLTQLELLGIWGLAA